MNPGASIAQLQWLWTFDNLILPRFRALRGMILWAVTTELLFSTTAKRRNRRSSKWTRKRNCSFHMGFRVLRWMGFVRKWQLSRAMPRTSTSIHGLPVLLLGHTFCPETIWGGKRIRVTEDAKETEVTSEPHRFPPQKRQRTLWNGPGEWLIRLLKKRSYHNQVIAWLESWENLFCQQHSPNYNLSTVNMFKYLQKPCN